MKDFQELEKENRSVMVELDDDGFQGSGTLALAGKDTVAVLHANKMLPRDPSNSGWFDVRLKTTDGVHVLLHNALMLRATMPNSQRDKVENHVFPNVVAINSDRLGKGSLVSAIMFKIDGLGRFFHYESVERHYLFDPDKETLSGLKALRKIQLSKEYPMTYDFFYPSEVLVIHNLPRIFRFRVRDRVYEAFRTRSVSHAFASETRLKSEPVLQISFDKAMTIDKALDAVWEWRRFFSQLAMAPLHLSSIAARSRSAPRHRWADLYLPNLNRPESGEIGPFDFHAGDSPYFLWRDRSKLGDLTQAWLTKEPSRRVFRVSLDRVIDSMQTQTRLEDVVTLCSAVESLSEFDAASGLTNQQIKLMADAAVGAATKAELPIKEARIQSLLGMLQHQGLPQRMKLLVKALDGLIPTKQMQDVAKAAHGLRQIASHGRALEDPVMPSVGPTIGALAGMCALYDLISCGAPATHSEGRRLVALRMAAENGMHLGWIKSQKRETPPA